MSSFSFLLLYRSWFVLSESLSMPCFHTNTTKNVDNIEKKGREMEMATIYWVVVSLAAFQQTQELKEVSLSCPLKWDLGQGGSIKVWGHRFPLISQSLMMR